MKKIIIVLFLFSALYGYGQIKSGIIFGGGKGSISNLVFPDEFDFLDVTFKDMPWQYTYKFDVALGYKFRLNLKTNHSFMI